MGAKLRGPDQSLASGEINAEVGTERDFDRMPGEARIFMATAAAAA